MFDSSLKRLHYVDETFEIKWTETRCNPDSSMSALEKVSNKM